MKKIRSLVMLLLWPCLIWAEHVDVNTASKVAKTFLSEKEVTLLSLESFGNLYIFNSENGFVIVAADNRVIPVLGYSDGFPFKTENMPENIHSWLQSLHDEIEYVVDQRLEATQEIRQSWELLSTGCKPEPKCRTAVLPLIKTHWDQGQPYNSLCPTNTYTGCVATAMAQLMKYWEWPKTGNGSHSYTHSTYGTLSANFTNGNYDWDNMVDMVSTTSPAAQQTAVATLMYHCGVSVNMDYGTSGSAAYSSDVMTALLTYFNYSSGMSIAYRENYANAAYVNLLKGELEAGRPLYYRGTGSGGGHAFLCDGYDENNYFHFNWGWSGYCDGYYLIGQLNPGPGGAGSGSSGSYNDGNFVFINCQPNTPPISAPTNVTASASDQEVSLSWSAVSGANHYKVYRDGFVVNANVSGVSFVDQNVPYGNHSYYVKAVNASGICSLRSDEVSVDVLYAGPVPTNLTANVQSNQVQLSWTAPANENAQLKYGEGTPTNMAYGSTSGTGYYWGQRFTTSQLSPYAGMAVTSVQTYLWDQTQYTLFIYKETDGELIQLLSQPFTNTSYGSWYTINLSTPLVIDYTSNLLVVIHNNTVQYVAAYMDNYTGGDGNARLSSTSGASFTPINANISWLIKTNISDGTYTYNVYRNGDAIVSNLSQTSYTDTGLQAGVYNYSVRTNYFGGLSEPSNTATANVGSVQYYTLNVVANPSDGGTVTGAGTYEHGAVATLSASANVGYSFVNWTKNGAVVSSSPEYSFTVTEAGTYVANFSVNSYAIVVSANPSDGGTVTGAGTYEHGAVATLSASANVGYSFVNWTKNGAVVSSSPEYSFAVTEAGTYVANFSVNSYVIGVSANPSSGGTVTGAGAYEHGAVATLSASANVGYSFVNWTKNGAVVSSSPEYSFTVTEAGDYVAHFILNSYEITAVADPFEGGEITGTGTYLYGESVTLTIVPKQNYTFVNWTENGMVVSDEPSLTIVVTEGHDYVANLLFYDAVGETDDGTTKLYPNPACDKLFIASLGSIERCEVYTVTGMLLYSATAAERTIELDMSGWPAGTYMVRLVVDGTVTHQKVIHTSKH